LHYAWHFVLYTQMHKKAFGDWAYSAPPYLAGLKSGRKGQGRGGRDKGGGKRQDTSSPTNNSWIRHWQSARDCDKYRPICTSSRLHCLPNVYTPCSVPVHW